MFVLLRNIFVKLLIHRQAKSRILEYVYRPIVRPPPTLHKRGTVRHKLITVPELIQITSHKAAGIPDSRRQNARS
jgi:hypothetical protein